jgi:hypothetical protein
MKKHLVVILVILAIVMGLYCMASSADQPQPARKELLLTQKALLETQFELMQTKLTVMQQQYKQVMDELQPMLDKEKASQGEAAKAKTAPKVEVPKTQ